MKTTYSSIMEKPELLGGTDQSHQKGSYSHAGQSLPDSAMPEAEEIRAEQLRVLHSASSGALVQLFYSGFMRVWIFFIVEIVIFLSAFWLPIIINYFPGSLASDAGPLLSSLFFIVVSYLFFSLVKVILGKRLAWKARNWASFGHFLSVQKRWDVAGRVVLVISSLLIGGVLATSLWLNMNSMPTYLPNSQLTN